MFLEDIDIFQRHGDKYTLLGTANTAIVRNDGTYLLEHVSWFGPNAKVLASSGELILSYKYKRGTVTQHVPVEKVKVDTEVILDVSTLTFS